jgi:hypothetical protein
VPITCDSLPFAFDQPFLFRIGESGAEPSVYLYEFEALFWWVWYDYSGEGVAFYSFDILLGSVPADAVRLREIYKSVTTDYIYITSEVEHVALFAFPNPD